MFSLKITNAPEIANRFLVYFDNGIWSDQALIGGTISFHLDLSTGIAEDLKIAIVDDKNWYINSSGTSQFEKYYFYTPLSENGDYVFDFSTGQISPNAPGAPEETGSKFPTTPVVVGGIVLTGLVILAFKRKRRLHG